MRYDTPPAGDADPLPDWGDPDAPLVYVSYGTVTATVGPFAAVYPATVAALADRPVRVLLTTGDGADVAALGPLPDNVRVERFRPQQAVMPLAAAAIGHGGFGTTMTALVHAVPLVVLPLFAFDQFVNADAVAAAGAGLAVAGEVDGVGRLADAVDAVLADDAYSAGARRIAEEIASQPPVGSAVTVWLLERLGGRPADYRPGGPGTGTRTRSGVPADDQSSSGASSALVAHDVESASSWTSTWVPSSRVTSTSYRLSSSPFSVSVTRPPPVCASAAALARSSSAPVIADSVAVVVPASGGEGDAPAHCDDTNDGGGDDGCSRPVLHVCSSSGCARRTWLCAPNRALASLNVA